jgi:Outer membrane protein beta-barrel domain
VALSGFGRSVEDKWRRVDGKVQMGVARAPQGNLRPDRLRRDAELLLFEYIYAPAIEGTAIMRCLLALLLTLASAQTIAQEARGPYIGFGIDQINYSNSIYRIDYDDSIMSEKLTAGFRFHDSLSLEATYSPGNDFSVTETGTIFPPFTSPIGPIGGDVTAHFDGSMDIFQARAISHQGHVLLGIGFFATDTDLSLSGTSASYGPFGTAVQESDSGYLIFLGLHWDIGQWAVRGEYSYYDMENEADASSFGTGFLYRF